MNEMKSILQTLAKPLPPELVKSKPGFKDRNGQSAEINYIEWFAAADILDALHPEWTVEIVEVGQMTGYIYVRVALTINSVRRENIGFENSSTDSYGDPFSNAYAMAFKRACAMFGLGRYLYGGKHTSASPESKIKPVPMSVAPRNAPSDKAATEKQLNAVNKLLGDKRLTEAEVIRLEMVLEKGLTHSKAREILDYFYGETVKQDGRWIKATFGVLKKRKHNNAA